jgi:hypothetical protein
VPMIRKLEHTAISSLTGCMDMILKMGA